MSFLFLHLPPLRIMRYYPLSWGGSSDWGMGPRSVPVRCGFFLQECSILDLNSPFFWCYVRTDGRTERRRGEDSASVSGSFGWASGGPPTTAASAVNADGMAFFHHEIRIRHRCAPCDGMFVQWRLIASFFFKIIIQSFSRIRDHVAIYFDCIFYLWGPGLFGGGGGHEFSIVSPPATAAHFHPLASQVHFQGGGRGVKVLCSPPSNPAKRSQGSCS